MRVVFMVVQAIMYRLGCGAERSPLVEGKKSQASAFNTRYNDATRR